MEPENMSNLVQEPLAPYSIRGQLNYTLYKRSDLLPALDNSIDVLEDLSSRPDEQGRYRVIVTSPPYYGHRHYGADPHEIDQEQTSEAFIQIGHRFCNMRRSLDGEWKPLNSNEILDVGIKNS